jgi:putative hydrolase of the HAD superfamily
LAHSSKVLAVALDAAGTLFEPKPDVATAYCAAAAQHGFKIDLAEVQRRLPMAMSKHFPQSWDDDVARTSSAKQLQQWQDLVADVLCEVPEKSRALLFEDLWHHFRRPESWQLFSDVPPALDILRSKGLRLVIASNFDERLHDVVAGIPELRGFELIAASADLGFQKPCRGFYRRIEELLELPPHQLAMIGDSYRADYEGAKAAGWNSWYLDRIMERTGGEQQAESFSSLIEFAKSL